MFTGSGSPEEEKTMLALVFLLLPMKVYHQQRKLWSLTGQVRTSVSQVPINTLCPPSPGASTRGL